MFNKYTDNGSRWVAFESTCYLLLVTSLRNLQNNQIGYLNNVLCGIKCMK